MRAVISAIALTVLSIASATTVAQEQAATARPIPGSDEAELWFEMDRVETQLRQSPLLVRNEALDAYLRGVLCKVAQPDCSRLRVYVVDLPYFNASMAANGAMIVWTGALLRIRNEAQLAMVLGHEYGHFRERHTLEQWRRMKRSSAVLGAFGAMASGAGLGVAGMAANLGGVFSAMKFSRAKELEADRIGFEQLSAQGYDPDAAVELWNAMLREESARDYGKPVPVFSTHPDTRQRRDDLLAALNGLDRPGTELGTQPYARTVHPFLQHWLENELTRRMFSSSIEVIGELRQAGAAGDAGLYSFFLGEAYRRRDKADDRARAAGLYAEAVQQSGAPPEAFREHGLALRGAGHRAEAAAALHQYLLLQPKATDKAFIDAYLAELELRS